MKKLYKDQNGKVYVDDGNLEEMAIALGFEPVEKMEELEDLITTEVIKDGKWLSEKAIKDYYDKYKVIYDKVYGNMDISKKTKSSIIADIDEFLFIPTLEYRGGEKAKVVTARVSEDPVEKYKDWEDYEEFYEIVFENMAADSLWLLMKDIYRELQEFND